MLILGSGSVYRRQLLERLQLPFQVLVSDLDETARAGETPMALSERLAVAKARAVARLPQCPPGAWIIGSDQVACDGATIYGKPGTIERAQAQLHALSGRRLMFHTALCLLDSARDQMQTQVVSTEVQFRVLSDVQISAYLAREPALDCAGAAKSEGLGISLIAAQRGDDPTALVGLPLIALTSMLAQWGLTIPHAP